ncbi:MULTISPECIES: GNAT family N-acetyltransferase [Algibacter]|uniref:GNAT family N-acetyltransferase n=1 Tax=Algibacter TaxID=261827 RepID=UPI00131D7A7F|nr:MULTISPECIES: GNAT family N-acetyltransferase [Algibacter]MDO7138978.1 GNAT family N-acetyltransferase [Algibacter lectus]
MKKHNYNVKQIQAVDTYTVRHPVLRKGKPIESCIFDGDDLETTLHFGIYNAEELIGVCSLLKNNNPKFSELKQYQLRGMAVLQSQQGLGVGNILLEYCDNILKEEKTDLIWCNAREVAVNFYKRNGYCIIGDSFNITGIGPHFVMKKQLDLSD